LKQEKSTKDFRMNTPLAQNPQQYRESESEPEVYALEDWRVLKYDVIGSTNMVAASLPAWTAVCADAQTAGRGRFQRRWVSDQGGLWLSAVIPLSEDPIAAKALPLAVGLAVCEALQEIGVTQLRMRWPNDLLVLDRKLAGLLLDRFTPGLAVAGIGINVFNRPELCDPNLGSQIIRLADLIPTPPQLSELTSLLLRNLRRIVLELEAIGFDSMLPRVNQLWGAPRLVELDLDGEVRRGLFERVDHEGRLILSDGSRATVAYEAHQVRHLQEI
jgi:BirA family biotin operon repressor/biotin-[acetyl-CoA-carboxylase] ligase